MADKPKALPMAPEALQKKFTELELQNFAYDGIAPKAILSKALDDNPDLLKHTFIGSNGQKTNLLVELLRVDRPVLAAMVVADFKEKIPETMIKGYNPDDASPLLAPLPLALRYSAPLSIALIEQGAPVTDITPEDRNVMHQMMMHSHPETIKAMLEYLGKKLPENERKDLFAARDANGKTATELMTRPAPLVPFTLAGYMSKQQMEKLGDGWLDARIKKLQAIKKPDENAIALTYEILSMHEAFKKAGIQSNISKQAGEKLIEFSRAHSGYSTHGYHQLGSMLEYADQDAKNAWLYSATEYQGNMSFPVMATELLLEKGAKPDGPRSIHRAIYAEDIGMVKALLDSCNNRKDFINTDTGQSAVDFALTCGFCDEKKRVPIIALLAKRGAELTERSYEKPMITKVLWLGTAGVQRQQKFVDECMQHHLPCPKGLAAALERSWMKYDQKEVPAEETLKLRMEIRSALQRWEKETEMQRALKGVVGFAPDIKPASVLDGVESPTGLPAAIRHMVLA